MKHSKIKRYSKMVFILLTLTIIMQCMVCGCSKKTEECITYTVRNESFETEIEVESCLMIINNSGLTSVKYNLTNGDIIRVTNNQLTWWHTNNTIECFNNCEVYLNDTK